MNKIRIGINGSDFLWGGGIDFVLMLLEALESTDKVETYLMLEENSLFGKMCIGLQTCLNRDNSFKDMFKIKKNNDDLKSAFLKSLNLYSPNTKKFIIKKTENNCFSNREKKIEYFFRKNQIDIFLSYSEYKFPHFTIPRIGYIYDFQHKYLLDYFSEEECSNRDLLFQEQLNNLRYIIVNAQEVKRDIERFFPDHKSEIIVLPFKPFQKMVCNGVKDIEKYHLPHKYYVICNQFWMHKSHITAFEALELLYNKGIRDIHIVCTGLLKDDRNPHYIDELMDRISTLKCRDNIHFLGYIPKEDQMEVLTNAIGLIQPTLFEGGPGGGAVYNALCFGVPCLVSNIPVNQEIIGYDNVYFFEKENSNELANLMLMHKNDTHTDKKTADRKSESNKKEYGEYLYLKMLNIIDDFYKN
ncbi:MAG: glycosyltransferase [Lachnospiraceae bacterium]|nr:glycosyltransferase [Lachnospiraceae bacterium]